MTIPASHLNVNPLRGAGNNHNRFGRVAMKTKNPPSTTTSTVYERKPTQNQFVMLALRLISQNFFFARTISSLAA
jgi:hypothetical protein